MIKILYIITCAINFSATDEQGLRSEGDEKFGKESKLGISHILEAVCKLSNKKYPEVHREAQAMKI